MLPLAAAVLTCWRLGAAGARPRPAKPEAGTDYLVLDKPRPVDAPAGKVEVVEFFWYSCPHCNAFEPTLEAWVSACPRMWRCVACRWPSATTLCRSNACIYALEAMGLVDKLHAKVFAAIHVEKQQPGQGRGHRRLGGQAGRGQGQVHGAVQLVHRSPPRPAAPPNCKTPTRSKACPLWVWPAGSTPMAHLPRAWSARCRWSNPC